MTTRIDIKNLMAYIMMAFPNYNPALEGEVNAIDVMFDLLGDLDADLLKTAVRTCCTESGRAFPPSSGEIRGAAENLIAEISGYPTPGEAWGAIIGSYERMPGGNMAGGGHGFILDNPLVREAMHQMGGFTSGIYEEQAVNRAHFFKIYQTILNQKMTREIRLPSTMAYIEEHKLPALTDGEEL